MESGLCVVQEIYIFRITERDVSAFAVMTPAYTEVMPMSLILMVGQ